MHLLPWRNFAFQGNLLILSFRTRLNFPVFSKPFIPHLLLPYAVLNGVFLICIAPQSPRFVFISLCVGLPFGYLEKFLSYFIFRGELYFYRFIFVFSRFFGIFWGYLSCFKWVIAVRLFFWEGLIILFKILEMVSGLQSQS